MSLRMIKTEYDSVHSSASSYISCVLLTFCGKEYLVNSGIIKFNRLLVAVLSACCCVTSGNL